MKLNQIINNLVIAVRTVKNLTKFNQMKIVFKLKLEKIIKNYKLKHHKNQIIKKKNHFLFKVLRNFYKEVQILKELNKIFLVN